MRTYIYLAIAAMLASVLSIWGAVGCFQENLTLGGIFCTACAGLVLIAVYRCGIRVGTYRKNTSYKFYPVQPNELPEGVTFRRMLDEQYMWLSPITVLSIEDGDGKEQMEYLFVCLLPEIPPYRFRVKHKKGKLIIQDRSSDPSPSSHAFNVPISSAVG